jgi:hypothetical protein
LLVCVLSFGFGDIYWVSAWVVLTLMPPLLLLTRYRPRWAWIALLALALTAGSVTAVRSQAGLGVVLAAAAVTVMVCTHWWRRLAVVAAVALAYLAPTLIVLPLIRDHRDHVAHTNLSAQVPAAHPLWHSVYIGFGYTENRYGIHYSDSYAAAAAEQADPHVRYLSSAYAQVLHKQVDALIRRDPGFVAKAEAQKAAVELSHAGRYILLLVLLLPAALISSGAARLRWWDLALFAPSLVIGFIPAIVAVPFREYELGLLAPLGTLGLLAIGSTAARLEEQWRGMPRGSSLRDRRRALALAAWRMWPRQSTARWLLGTALILAVALIYARHLEAAHQRWDSKERTPVEVVLAAASTRPSPPA